MESVFLNYLKVPLRQVWVNGFQVDGMSADRGKIYEFLGDYWHGNLKKYDPQVVNEITKKTYSELNLLTRRKFLALNALGYPIYYVWESDWKIWLRNNDSISLPIKRFRSDMVII
jgi:hypothetical protein